MAVAVRESEIFIQNMRTRMPFRYGIATLTGLPHLMLRLTVTVDGKAVHGWSADHLPPKWFTKDPQTAPRQEIDDMLAVIRRACGHAIASGEAPTPFRLWRNVLDAQHGSPPRAGMAALLLNFGVSLVERAVIDAFCRARKQTFAAALRGNTLGIDLGELHPTLAAAQPAGLLPCAGQRSIIVRHTVGLADPLSAADVLPDQRAGDGLPRSLESCIRTYGLTHFKIKLRGDAQQDVERLREISKLLGSPLGLVVTLDGNENYRDVAALREFCELASPLRLLDALLFIEQPMHRNVALSDATAREFVRWSDRPPMIIDESDDHIDSGARALSVGYRGVSIKSCKGVFKGVANACLMRKENGLVSGEDLSTVGPISLLQDLALMSAIGINHAERNGHHYFRGLSAFDRRIQDRVLAAHGDLYRSHEDNLVTVAISGGQVNVGSVVDAPFGYGFDFDPIGLTPLEKWDYESL